MPGAAYDAASAAIGNHAHEILFGLAYEGVRAGERLLDVGIGTGLASAPFHRAGLGIVGLDTAEEMLASCRAKGIAERLVVHDVRDVPWPFAAARFDHALACGVAHFLEELDLLLGEMARVVRPDASLAFTTLEVPPLSSSLPLFVHPRALVLACARTHGLAIVKDVAFSTPSSPARDALVGFRAYLARRQGGLT